MMTTSVGVGLGARSPPGVLLGVVVGVPVTVAPVSGVAVTPGIITSVVGEGEGEAPPATAVTEGGEVTVGRGVGGTVGVGVGGTMEATGGSTSTRGTIVTAAEMPTGV